MVIADNNFVKIPKPAVTVLHIMFKIVIYSKISFDIDSSSFEGAKFVQTTESSSFGHI